MSFMVPQAGATPSAPVPQASLMGGLAKAFPSIATSLQTFGTLKSGIDQSNALKTNSQAYSTEAGIAARQGAEQEAQQRRAGEVNLGRETAAAGMAGAGYGGSTGRALTQSALNTELDALNIRYKSNLQRWAFTTQAQNLKDEAAQARQGAFMKAGAALLTGFSRDYQAA